MKKLFLLLVFTSVLIEACRYKEGPDISFRTPEKRLFGSWEITKFLYGDLDNNPADSTESYKNKVGCRLCLSNVHNDPNIPGHYNASMINCKTGKVYDGYWWFSRKNDKTFSRDKDAFKISFYNCNCSDYFIWGLVPGWETHWIIKRLTKNSFIIETENRERIEFKRIN